MKKIFLLLAISSFVFSQDSQMIMVGGSPWELVEYMDFEDNLIPSSITTSGTPGDLTASGGKLRFANLALGEEFGWISATDDYDQGDFFLAVVDFDSIWSSTQNEEWLRLWPQIVGINNIGTYQSSLGQGQYTDVPWDSITSLKYTTGSYIDTTMRTWGTPNQGSTIVSPGDYIHFKIHNGHVSQTWNGAIETMAIYKIDRANINSYATIVNEWHFPADGAVDWVASGGASSAIANNSLYVSGLRSTFAAREVRETFTSYDINSLYWVFAEDTLTDSRQKLEFYLGTSGYTTGLGVGTEIDGSDEYWGLVNNYETEVPSSTYSIVWLGDNNSIDGHEYLTDIYLYTLPKAFFENWPQ